MRWLVALILATGCHRSEPRSRKIEAAAKSEPTAAAMDAAVAPQPPPAEVDINLEGAREALPGLRAELQKIDDKLKQASRKERAGLETARERLVNQIKAADEEIAHPTPPFRCGAEDD